MTSAADAMRATAEQFAKAPRLLAQTGADVLVEALERQLVRDTSGDRRLTNLDERAPIPTVQMTEDTATVTAHGAVWAILENGTQGHVIRPHRRVLRIGEKEWRSGPVRVRGVRARHTYSLAVERGSGAVMDAQREQWEAMHRGR